MPVLEHPLPESYRAEQSLRYDPNRLA
jgi:hypothetical protein